MEFGLLLGPLCSSSSLNRTTSLPTDFAKPLAMVEMDGDSHVEKRRKMEEECQDLINKLPEDCIAKIFGFLLSPSDRGLCAEVSKKWLRILANMRVADFAELSPLSQQPPEPFVRRLSGKKANDIRLTTLAGTMYPLRTLSQLCLVGTRYMPSSSSSFSPTLTDYGLGIIAKASPQLKSLILWDCLSIGDKGFKLVGQWCGKSLEELDLSNSPLLTDCGLVSLANDCLNLSVLSLKSCPRIGSPSLEAFAENNFSKKIIRSVSLENCPLIQDSGIISLVCNLSKLSTLNLARMKIGDVVLEAIGVYGKALRALHLEKIEGLKEEISYSWIGGLEELYSLKLRYCVGLASQSLNAMIGVDHSFAGLQDLEIRGCGDCITDHALTSLSKSSQRVKKFKLEECSGFTSKGLLEALANWRGSLKLLSLKKCVIYGRHQLVVNQEENYYPSLTTLELKQCVCIGVDILPCIGPACRQAKHISLAGTKNVTNQGFLSLMNWRDGTTNLKSLDLTGCAMISDGGLGVAIRDFGKHLRCLGLDHCIGLSDKIFALVAIHCNALEELSAAHCKISDRGLMFVVRFGRERLQTLFLSGCGGITDRSLEYMEKMTCENLVGLDIRNCSGLSEDGIDSVRTMMWWCEIVS